MATKSPTRPTIPDRLDDHPRVQAALTIATPLHAQREALREEHGVAHRIGGYGNQYTNAPHLAPAPEDILKARIRLKQIPDELEALGLQIIAADRAVEDARRVTQLELAKALDQDDQPTLLEFHRRLKELAEINLQLAERDERRQRILGPAQPRWAWAELLPENPATQSRLDCWRRAAATYGLAL